MIRFSSFDDGCLGLLMLSFHFVPQHDTPSSVTATSTCSRVPRLAVEYHLSSNHVQQENRDGDRGDWPGWKGHSSLCGVRFVTFSSCCEVVIM